MIDPSLEILESSDETSVYRNDELLATFYGTATDPSGHAKALFFASRYGQRTLVHDVPAVTVYLPDAPVSQLAQLSLTL